MRIKATSKRGYEYTGHLDRVDGGWNWAVVRDGDGIVVDGPIELTMANTPAFVRSAPILIAAGLYDNMVANDFGERVAPPHYEPTREDYGEVEEDADDHDDDRDADAELERQAELAYHRV